MGNTNSNNTGMWVAAGVAVAGLSYVLLNSKARNKVVDTSLTMKDSITDYASTVKNDPMGVKDNLIDRIKRTSSITMEAVTKIQDILNDEGKHLKEAAADLMEDSKEIMSTAMDAKDDLMEVKDKALDAKDAIMSSGDSSSNSDSKSNSSSSKSSNSSKMSKPEGKQLSRAGGEKTVQTHTQDAVSRTNANRGSSERP